MNVQIPSGHKDKLVASAVLILTGLFALLLPPSTVVSQQAQSAPDRLPGQTVTVLSDGRWLYVGGENVAGSLNSASIWNPSTGATTPLSGALQHERAWHTATILPDGFVLILGGVGMNKQVVSAAELFDPTTLTFSNFPSSGVTPRAHHTATLLSDGHVLIAGGNASNGEVIQHAELWDALSPSSASVDAPSAARRGHTAQLLPDGRVLLWGGTDGALNALNNGEIFDPATQRFTPINTFPSELIPASSDGPTLVASIPVDRSLDVDTENIVSLRFSKPLRAETVNSSTVSLSGPKGLEKISVVSAENGSLAFITPDALLLPGATYVVTVNGAIDRDGLALPVSGISFSTKAAGAIQSDSQTSSSASNRLQTFPTFQQLPSMTPSVASDGWTWIGKLKDGRPHSDWEDLPQLQAPDGVTALAGQVIDIQGLPLARVTLTMESEYGSESKAVQTDETGRFLLTGIKQGRGELIIDGRQGRNPNSGNVNSKWGYGVYEYGVDIKPGKTNPLGFTIWLTKIDSENVVHFPAHISSEVVVTSPRIPGLELHLPPSTTVYDHEGKPVNQISLTQIPLDRTPFPLPEQVQVPIYFTAQPGGAYISSETGIGARIHYPNRFDAQPGYRALFWHYDAGYRGWYVYGRGEVSADGTQIVPDPGVSINELTGAMVGFPGGAPTTGKKCRDVPGCKKGDPVDVQTGLFVHEKTDLVVADVMPITLTRTYRNEDSFSRAFGRGTNHLYDMFLTNTQGCYCYNAIELIMPDGGRVRYDRISPGTGYADAVFEATKSPTFYKSRIAWNSGGWDLTLKDGTVYKFGENAPIQGIRDRYGNEISIARTNGQLGNILSITSVTSGRSISFTYDASNRITQARDNIGRTVNYEYDPSGRLWRVTDPMNGVTEYTYDSAHRMLSIKDPRGIVYLTIEYTSGKVSKQTQADGSTFQFAYTTNANGDVTQTDVTDPRGNLERVEFNADGQLIRETKARTKPEEQVTDYERQTGTNLLLSVTDALEATPGVRRKTVYTYDEKGNVLTTTRNAQDSNQANWVTTTYTYEPTFNQVATITDPLGAGHTTTFTYDSVGNLQTIQDPLSHQTTYTYNAQGQPLTVTTPAGITQFVYDFGDLVSVIDPMGNVTTRGLDAIGRLQSMTNPLGLTTSYAYDNLNRMTGVTDPLSGITQFGYDANSNLLSVSDAKAPSGVTGYTYNNMDRLQTRTDPLLKAESYVYDASGNLTLFRDRKLQATTYAYDALNRRATVTYADGSNTIYTYDKGNRLTQISDSTAGNIIRTYDSLDRLTSEQTLQGTVGYTYDAASRRATMTVPNQALITYTYDNANRLTQITQGTSIVQFGYDNANRRTSLTLPNNIRVEYGYDAASRITSITYKQNGTTVIGDLTYEYDKAGNRTKIGGSWARTGMPEPITTTSYDANNRQLTFGDKTLAYDDNGNLQSITDANGTTLYQWNARNQLVGISGPSVNASFVYDGTGRRERKTINGILTEFLYDGGNPVQETAGATVVANILTGLQLDAFFSRNDIGTGITSSFLFDSLGSTIALADSTGTVQTETVYEPFGGVIASGTSNTNSFQYTGRENDSTGVYYYRTRYYHPAFQRFIGEDPIGFGGGDVNLYAYASNSPVKFTDPLGLDSYMCTSPLHALGKSGEWLYGKNVPLLYHQFICVKNGVISDCGGQDRDTDWPYGNGKQSNDSMKNGKCVKIDDRPCMDRCLEQAIRNPNRPWYGLIGPGTNCQEWAKDAYSKCMWLCKGS